MSRIKRIVDKSHPPREREPGESSHGNGEKSIYLVLVAVVAVVQNGRDLGRRCLGSVLDRSWHPPLLMGRKSTPKGLQVRACECESQLRRKR